ncbi:MAG: hypothetical protein JO015_12550 [Verrucomicrobia bacterium]|nr:hypothetical protein [Verrucomicrobiota bacterium]
MRLTAILSALLLVASGLRAQEEFPTVAPTPHPFLTATPHPAAAPAATATPLVTAAPGTPAAPPVTAAPAATAVPSTTVAPFIVTQPSPAPSQVIPEPDRPVPPAGVVAPVAPQSKTSFADVARYLAGLPVPETSPLAPLTRDPQWIAHANAMNSAFATLEQRQFANIRQWRTEVLSPVTQASQACLYLFSGPDFLYPSVFYPDCRTYLLQGLEPADPLPDLSAILPAALLGAVQDAETALNTVLNFSFFKTKDMRVDLQRGQLKGVIPLLFLFLARSGNDVAGLDYVSVDRDGHLLDGRGGATRGVKISAVNTKSGAQKVIYYFTADLSDDALKRNSGLLRFYESFGHANAFVKAASYLMHEPGFNVVRNYLLSASATILQDDSGIPVRDFTPDQWTLRFFGTYPGPISLFAKFYQPELHQYYQVSSPKPLTFGFGYRWSRHNSTLILAVRK